MLFVQSLQWGEKESMVHHTFLKSALTTFGGLTKIVGSCAKSGIPECLASRPLFPKGMESLTWSSVYFLELVHSDQRLNTSLKCKKYPIEHQTWLNHHKRIWNPDPGWSRQGVDWVSHAAEEIATWNSLWINPYNNIAFWSGMQLFIVTQQQQLETC